MSLNISHHSESEREEDTQIIITTNMEPVQLLCFLPAAPRQLALYQTLKVQTHFNFHEI